MGVLICFAALTGNVTYLYRAIVLCGSEDDVVLPTGEELFYKALGCHDVLESPIHFVTRYEDPKGILPSSGLLHIWKKDDAVHVFSHAKDPNAGLTHLTITKGKVTSEEPMKFEAPQSLKRKPLFTF